MNFVAAAIAVMAAVVALQYLVLGFYVVPRLSRLVDEPGPLIRRAQAGGTGFFFGCGMTHVLLLTHAILEPAYYADPLHAWGHAIFHVFQIAGGLTFIAIVGLHLDIRISPKNWAAAEREKEQLLERLQELATRDHLTGLLNRRAFDEAMAEHGRFISRYGPSGGVLMLDLDGFKQANDRLGHSAGDEVLVKVADALRESVRATDVIGRMGGDEFAVLLREAGPKEVEGTAERVVREIGRIADPAPVKASVGVAACVTQERVLEAADKAMYAAKQAGGDRYVVAEAG